MALSDNLVAYYSLEEASGTRADATGRGNDLDTPVNTPGNTTGKIGNAISLVAGSSQAIYRASTTDLVMNGSFYTVCCWVKLTSVSSNTLWAKWNHPNKEYGCYVEGSIFKHAVSPDTSAQTTLSSTFGTPATGTWYFVACWYDGTKIYIQVNNGTIDSTNYSSGIANGTNPFAVGRLSSGGLYLMNGAVDELGVWKRVLTSDERTDLYNSGTGRDYAYIAAGAAGQPMALRRSQLNKPLFGRGF